MYPRIAYTRLLQMSDVPATSRAKREAQSAAAGHKASVAAAVTAGSRRSRCVDAVSTTELLAVVQDDDAHQAFRATKHRKAKAVLQAHSVIIDDDSEGASSDRLVLLLMH